MRNLPSEEVRFANNATIMGHAISNGVNTLNNAGYKTIEPIKMLFAVSLIESHGKDDPHNLINLFILNSHEVCWDKIKERDEKFFLENVNKIFSVLPAESINLFKDLFLTVDKNGKNVISQQLKDEIWGLFDAMIKISIKYIAKQQIQNPEKYAAVNLQKHAKTWEVKL